MMNVVEHADVVFAYSVIMALGVCDAVRDQGLDDRVVIVDCDGFINGLQSGHCGF